MPVLIIIVLGLIVYFIYKGALQTHVISSWQQLFDIQFSSQEFYSTVEGLIKSKEIPGIELSRITYGEGGLLSPHREYLRVKFKTYVFDICAAPFAKEFFVSWWHAELSNKYREYFQNKTTVNISGSSGRQKTYYELDTEAMFKAAVTECVNAAVRQMTEARGYRVPGAVPQAASNPA